MQQQEEQQQQQQQHAVPTVSSSKKAKRKYAMPKCGHNSWDKVRVAKGVMTLRCRVCMKQWRAPVEYIWESRCEVFVRGGECGGGCGKHHVHGKKQTLVDRVSTHGNKVLDKVRFRSLPEPLLLKVIQMKEGEVDSSEASSTCYAGSSCDSADSSSIPGDCCNEMPPLVEEDEEDNEHTTVYDLFRTRSLSPLF